MNHLELAEKTFTKTDVGAANLSESAGLGTIAQLADMRKVSKISAQVASQFPASNDLLFEKSIAMPKPPEHLNDQPIIGVPEKLADKTGDKTSDNSADKSTEWPKDPKPSEIFQGHSRNLQRAGEVFPGMDPESVHKNQLAQRYLNSKEHLGDQPLTKAEEEELFKNPAVKKRLDDIIKNDRPAPRFN